MKLRHPNPGDMDQIMALGRRLHAEGWYASLDYDPETLRETLDHAMAADNMLALVLEAADGKLAGFFLAAETRHFFGRDHYACDLACYVAPEHRGGPGFVRMVRAYEAWCRIRGVREIHIGVSSGVTAERTARMFTKLGYSTPAMAFRKKCVWPD